MNALRAAVSGGRSRFKDEEFDLDLSYITDRVIAMGLPASGIEGTYRNNITDVAAMLERYHRDRFMVFNLSERKYDYSKFANNVLEFGWLDHHGPPLALLFQLVYSMHQWVASDPKNIAVVHCIAGKGRTGCAVSSFLIYEGIVDTPEAALVHFAKRRSATQNPSHGVSFPCQKRYVSYFWQLLMGFTPRTKPLMLVRLVMNGVPDADGAGGSKPYFSIYFENTKLIFTNKRFARPVKKEDEFVVFEQQVQLHGDILFTFKSDNDNLFRFSFHTGFINGQVLRLYKKDIDNAHKGGLPKDFFIDLFFQEVPEQGKDRTIAHQWPWDGIVKAYQKRMWERLWDPNSPNPPSLPADPNAVPVVPTSISEESHSAIRKSRSLSAASAPRPASGSQKGPSNRPSPDRKENPPTKAPAPSAGPASSFAQLQPGVDCEQVAMSAQERRMLESILAEDDDDDDRDEETGAPIPRVRSGSFDDEGETERVQRLQEESEELEEDEIEIDPFFSNGTGIVKKSAGAEDSKDTNNSESKSASKPPAHPRTGSGAPSPAGPSGLARAESAGSSLAAPASSKDRPTTPRGHHASPAYAASKGTPPGGSSGFQSLSDLMSQPMLSTAAVSPRGRLVSPRDRPNQQPPAIATAFPQRTPTDQGPAALTDLIKDDYIGKR